MTDTEKRKLVEELGKWFTSRHVSPDDGMPILAAMMCVACVSSGGEGQDLKDTTTRVIAASRLVMETWHDWLADPKGGWLA